MVWWRSCTSLYSSLLRSDTQTKGNLPGPGLATPLPGYLCAVQLVVIKNSVFMNNVLPTLWYGGEAVRLGTVPYSVQIYDAKQTEFWNTKFKNHVISNSDRFAVVKIESYVNVTFASCTFFCGCMMDYLKGKRHVCSSNCVSAFPCSTVHSSIGLCSKLAG